MEWRPIVEGVAVAALLVAAMAAFGDPQATLAVLGRVETVPYALALGSTLVGILIWSLSLARLLAAQGHRVAPGRFQATFVAGMGLRSVVPGGSTSGPIVLAYVVSRATGVPGETSVAMTSVLEVFLWIGTTVVGFVGFVGVLAFVRASPQLLALGVGLVVLAAIIFGVLLAAVRNPRPLERLVDRTVAWLQSKAGDRSNWLVGRLDPEAIDERIERFVDAFRQLGRDPSHLGPALATAILGWFVHASTLYFVLLAVDVHVSVFAPLIVVPTSGLAEGLSILPGGIGVVEPTFLALLVFVTPVNLPTAATVVLLYRLSNYWFRVGLGFASLPLLGLGDLLHASVTEPT